MASSCLSMWAGLNSPFLFFFFKFNFLQYTPPATVAEYVHRVGRTARIGGRGSSLLFLTPAETAFISELANHNIRCAAHRPTDSQSLASSGLPLWFLMSPSVIGPACRR